MLEERALGQWHMGINLGHDRSVAIVRNGEIVVAIEQERLDRCKHSVGLMLQAPADARQIQVPAEAVGLYAKLARQPTPGPNRAERERAECRLGQPGLSRHIGKRTVAIVKKN